MQCQHAAGGSFICTATVAAAAAAGAFTGGKERRQYDSAEIRCPLSGGIRQTA